MCAVVGFERPTDSDNNHHYWRGLAATAIGVAAADDKLFRFGVDAYKEAIADIDGRGAFPLEMARHENAIRYQCFALEPLVVIAQLASRQGIDLYSYQAHKRNLRDAILFFGQAVDDPGLVRPYTSEPQAGGFKPSDFAAFAFYSARFGVDGLPPAIVHALQSPTTSARLGGSTTILAAK